MADGVHNRTVLRVRPPGGPERNATRIRTRLVAIKEAQGTMVQSRFFARACTCYASSEDVFQESVEAARHALKHLGPGQTERAYEDVMCNFLYDRHRPTRRQVPYFQVVDDHVVPIGIVDLEVDHCVILELKANVAAITQEHMGQLARYMRAAASRNTTDLAITGAVLLFARDGSLKVARAEGL